MLSACAAAYGVFHLPLATPASACCTASSFLAAASLRFLAMTGWWWLNGFTRFFILP
jgi:hypothetical protein